MAELNREKVVIRTSIIGIAANIVLALFKAVVGLLSHSIAIVLDAVNNLTDALSSGVTIVGMKLAMKPADRNHPFGHGRAEYISALIIAVIILYAGVTSLVESVKKIIEKDVPEYSVATLVIVAAAVFVKIALGLFVKSTGKKVNSDSLKASGQDALMDSIISFSTLVAAGVFLIWKISIEAYLGVLISALILKSGIETIRETLSKILGERIDAELSHEIKKTIASCDQEIIGAFDLVLNDYGPDKHIGSAHIEIPDTWTADKIDVVTRKITREVLEKNDVVMAAIGVYSVNTKHDSAAEIHDKVEKVVLEHKDIMQMHGFFVDEAEKNMRFDVIVSFDAPNMKGIYEHVVNDVKQLYPDYDVQVQFDFDISD